MDMWRSTRHLHMLLQWLQLWQLSGMPVALYWLHTHTCGEWLCLFCCMCLDPRCHVTIVIDTLLSISRTASVASWRTCEAGGKASIVTQVNVSDLLLCVVIYSCVWLCHARGWVPDSLSLALTAPLHVLQVFFPSLSTWMRSPRVHSLQTPVPPLPFPSGDHWRMSQIIHPPSHPGAPLRRKQLPHGLRGVDQSANQSKGPLMF